MSREALPLPEQVHHIRKNGDRLDVDYRLNHGLGIRTFAGPQILAVIPPSSHGWFGAEFALTYPVYAAGATALSAVIYAGRRVQTTHKVKSSAERQTAIREELGEPVDIIRHGKRRKGRELLLRWYGADNKPASDNPTELSQRLSKLIDTAAEQGIEHMAIATDWLSQQATDKTLEQFGTLSGGETLLADKKKLKVKVKDLQAADKVLTAKTSELRRLLDSLEVDTDESVIAWLVAKLNDPLITERYAHPKRDAGKQRFTSFIGNELESELASHEAGGRVKVPDEYGRKTVLRRSRSETVIQGAHVYRSSQWADNTKKSVQMVGQFEGSGHVLGSVRASSLETLMKRLTTADKTGAPMTRGELLSALYISLLEREVGDSEHQAAVKIRPTNTLASHPGSTLFERMEAERLVTFPRTKSRRQKDKEQTVGYKQRRNALLRSVVSLCLVGGAAGVGYGTAELGYQGYVLAYTQELNKYDQYAHKVDTHNKADPKHKIKGLDFDHWLAKQHDPLAHYIDAVDAVENVDFDFSVYMAKQYIEQFGLDSALNVFEQYGNLASDEWIQKAIKSLPPDFEIGNYGVSAIGDTDPSTNKALYTIKSLNGASTSGYWYTELFQQLNLGVASPPFTNRSLVVESDQNFATTARDGRLDRPVAVKLPSATTAITALKPDFLVQTPYLATVTTFGSTGGVQLPIRQDSQIVGARIVDANDATKWVASNGSITQLSQSGTYSFRPDNVELDKMQSAGITHPVLQYWVKLRHDGRSTVHNANDPLIDHNQADITAIANTVKRALGLPLNATNEQVYKAIQAGKYYSYTPFADAHITDIASDGTPEVTDDDTKTLSEIAGVLARLKAMNCNIADMTYELGTINGGADQDNIAYGFHNTDGDGNLSQIEAHMWSLTKADNIVDATPDKPLHKLPNPSIEAFKPPLDTPNNVLPDVAESLLVSALLVLAYGRRRQISGFIDEARADIATSGRNASAALEVIEASHYSAPGKVARNTTPRNQDEILRVSVKGLAAEQPSARRIIQAVQAQQKPVPLPVRRAVRRLLRHRPAMRRYLAH